jgi:hypothetical protein
MQPMQPVRAGWPLQNQAHETAPQNSSPLKSPNFLHLSPLRCSQQTSDSSPSTLQIIAREPVDLPSMVNLRASSGVDFVDLTTPISEHTSNSIPTSPILLSPHLQDFIPQAIPELVAVPLSPLAPIQPPVELALVPLHLAEDLALIHNQSPPFHQVFIPV